MDVLLAAIGLGSLDIIIYLIAVAIGAYIIYYSVGQTGLPEPVRLPVMLLILLLIVVLVLKVLGAF